MSLSPVKTKLRARANELFGYADLSPKWMPRKGEVAAQLRRLLGMSPKTYRKTLVGLSETVEQLMCAGKWDEIEFSKVPSVAFARYARAFTRRVPEKFTGFVEAVEKGEQKINAAAIFPIDIIKSLRRSVAAAGGGIASADAFAAELQWKALPNYMEASGGRAIVIADTSGSMTMGGSVGVTPLDVCISLALYASERMEGPFKDAFITFSTKPKLQVVRGTLFERIAQLEVADWCGTTDLGASFKLILRAAVDNNLPDSQMPTVVFVVSDMAFNGCTHGLSDFENIRAMYARYGYTMPTLVFWNVADSGNKPVTVHDKNTAMISGYSPAIAKSVFSCTDIDPLSLVLHTLGVARYELPALSV